MCIYLYLYIYINVCGGGSAFWNLISENFVTKSVSLSPLMTESCNHKCTRISDQQ